MVRRFSPLVLTLHFVADILLTILAVKGAEQLRLHLTTGLELRETFVQFVGVQPRVYLLILAIWICFFVLFGAFNSRRHESLLIDLGRVWISVTVSMLVLASTFYFLALQPPVAPSRLFYVYFYLLDLALVTCSHVAVFQLVGFLRRKGRHIRRVLLVGAGTQGRHVAVRLRGRDASGFCLVGHVSPASDSPIPGLPRLGDFEDLLEVVREHQIDDVVIALPASAHEEVLRVNARLQDTDVQLRILPDVFEMVAMRAGIEDFYGLPLISLRDRSMNPAQIAVKRAFDLTVSAVLCLLLLPLALLIAVCIRLSSPGPILIHQRRVGAGGKIFLMHKFRSMRWEPEHLDAPHVKQREDPRVTRVGRVIRRSSLDELPQLLNVLAGEMSLVGPRPELPVIVEQYEPWQRKRFNVPPGMTGWWQINGRSDLSMHQNTEIDLFYVQNYSILLDVQILFRTLGAVIRGRGAY